MESFPKGVGSDSREEGGLLQRPLGSFSREGSKREEKKEGKEGNEGKVVLLAIMEMESKKYC